MLYANDVLNFRPHEKNEEKEMLEVMNVVSIIDQSSIDTSNLTKRATATASVLESALEGTAA